MTDPAVTVGTGEDNQPAFLSQAPSAPTPAPVYRIVLTGGPCAGKSTSLAGITDRLQSLGFLVFCVPETASILIGGGVNLRPEGRSLKLATQAELLRVIMAMEDAFYAVAVASGQKSVVICDRGAMDGSAYMTRDAWSAMLNQNGWTEVGLRDQRYDAVLHLVTAADGAESWYTTANNSARSESAQEARSLDKLIQKAWTGHPHLRVIDNSTSFDDKVSRVTAAICRVVGVPEPQEIERKFLLRGRPSLSAALPVHFEEVSIEQTYLTSRPGFDSRRVRRRGQGGVYSYTHNMKRIVAPGINVEVEEPISGQRYYALLEEADPSRSTITKQRRVFLWENQYFEWDIFLEANSGLELLEIEVDSLDQPIKLPPFLTVEREVTSERDFSNHSLSLVAFLAEGRPA